MPYGHPYGKEMLEKLFTAAEHSRFIIEMAKELNLRYCNVYKLIKNWGILDEIKKILEKNRIEHPKLTSIYSKEFVLNLAGTSISLTHMGKRMTQWHSKGLCRERVRQICELYNIEEEVHLMFKINRIRMKKILEQSEPLKQETYEFQLLSEESNANEKKV